MKTTVSFDVDDVVADWNKKYVALAQELYGEQYGTLPTPTDWDQTNWPLTPVERTLLHMTWKTQPNFHADLDICPGASANLDYLVDLSKRTRLMWTSARAITPAVPSVHRQTCDWIESRLGIRSPLVVLTPDKPMVLDAAQAVIHVDDSIDAVRAIESYMRTMYALRERGSERTTRAVLLIAHQNIGAADRVDWPTLVRVIEATLLV